MSNNLRIVYDNAANRATITASQEAGSLVASNLKTDSKSDMWRSTGTTATLTVAFQEAEPVGVVVLPFTNMTSGSTIRVQVYRYSGDTTPTLDTGHILAVPYAPLGMFGWGVQPLGDTVHGEGTSAYAFAWFEHKLASKLVITLTDTGNPRGYVEAARMVAGSWWSPKFNADYGAYIEMVDGSKNQRSESFELRSERGGRARRLNLDLKQMDFMDRHRLWQVIQANGRVFPVFASLHPEDADSTLEQAYHVYGKVEGAHRMTHTSYSRYASQLQIEEV